MARIATTIFRITLLIGAAVLAFTLLESRETAQWQERTALRLVVDEHGTVTGVVFDKDGPTPDDLAAIARLSRLTRLDLNSVPVTPELLSAFEPHKELRSLSLEDSPISDDELRTLLHGQLSLRHLDLSGANHLHSPLDGLSSTPPLHSLLVSRCQWLTADSVRPVKSMTGLLEFVADESSMTDDAVSALTSLSQLRTLSLSQCNLLTDRSLQSISEMPSLKHLRLSAGFSLDGVIEFTTKHPQHLEAFRYELLSAMQPLVENHYRQTGTNLLIRSFENGPDYASPGPFDQLRICDEAGLDYRPLALIAYRIRGLQLNGSGINDSIFPLIARMTHLSSLDLSRTRITDEGCQSLEGLPKLVALDLSATDITDATLARLASLPHLTALNLSQTQISNEAWQLLPPLQSCWLLDVSDTRISGELTRMPLPLVSSLKLSGLNLTDADVTHLSKWQSLRELDLSGTSFNGSGLEPLADLQIWRLDLSNTQVDDATLEHIGRLDDLQWLSLARTRVTGETLDLITAPHMYFVDLSGTQLSVAGVEAMSRLMTNKSINLSDTVLGDEECEILKSMSLSRLVLNSDDVTFDRIANSTLAAQLNGLSLAGPGTVSSNALRTFTSLTELSLLRMKITPELSDTIAKLPRLSTLTLDGCTIDEDAFVLLNQSGERSYRIRNIGPDLIVRPSKADPQYFSEPSFEIFPRSYAIAVRDIAGWSKDQLSTSGLP